MIWLEMFLAMNTYLCDRLICYITAGIVDTGWPIKNLNNLALNYKTPKPKYIKLDIYFSKQASTDTYTKKSGWYFLL